MTKYILLITSLAIVHSSYANTTDVLEQQANDLRYQLTGLYAQMDNLEAEGARLQLPEEPLSMLPIGTFTAYSCRGITTEAEKLMNCPNGITSSGTKPEAGVTLACDPELKGKDVYLPELGTVLKCEDLGSRIVGDRFDIYLDTIQEAYEWGVREMRYKIL